MRISFLMKIFLLVLIYAASFANSIKFFFGVIPRNMKCLGEYLTENTVGKQFNFIIKFCLVLNNFFIFYKIF
jgi:hypothetical protein